MPALPALTLCLAVGPAVGELEDPAPGDAGDPLQGSLEDLIAEVTLPSEAVELRGLVDGAWVLQEVLRSRFAHSPTAVERLRKRMDGLSTHAVPRLWVQRLADRKRLARLRGTKRSREPPAPKGVVYDIPLADHPLVDAYIDYFTGRGRWFFRRWLARSERYIPMMRPILASYGLPEDTVYLAMIESGFKAQAHSVANAVGFWQFIRSTGKLYGLEQTTWLDERRDFVRATHAAASYLRDLHERFGDWHLAWAGYNAGGGRISRALRKFGVSDYWSLIEHRRSLQRETRHYVPKLIAAAIVAKNRERYGFTDIRPLEPLAYDEVEVTESTDLRLVSRRLQIPIRDLRELNPALLYDVTPPRRHAVMRVPRGLGEPARQLLAGLSTEQRLSYRQHRIGPGDTLYKIARRYATTVAAIRELNGIANPRALRAGRRLVIPTTRGGEGAAAKGRVARNDSDRPKAQARARKARRTRKPTARHVVSTGETLWSIAQRYGVTVARLKRWNGRRGNIIGVGEVLEIF